MKLKDNDGLHRRPNQPGGIWYFRYRTDAGTREFSTRTSLYAEAKIERSRMEAEMREMKPPTDLAKDSLLRAGEAVITYRKLHVAENTARNDRQHLAAVTKFFPERRLQDFALLDLRRYQVERIKFVRARMVNLELSFLRLLLKEANLWHRFAGYKPLPEDRPEPGRVLTRSEEDRLMAALDSKESWAHVAQMARIAINTGARGKELKTLRLCDLALDQHPRIFIRRAGTKTDGGERRVPLNGAALKAVFALVSRATALGSCQPDHYLLPADESKHTRATDPRHGSSGINPADSQKSIKTVWLRATKAANLASFTFHDLRHTFITRQAELGTPLLVTMEIVGHMSEEMVRYYTHISDTAMREAVTKIDHRRHEGQAVLFAEEEGSVQ